MLNNNSTSRLQRVPEEDDDFGLSDFPINPIDETDDVGGDYGEVYDEEDEDDNSDQTKLIYWGIFGLIVIILGVGGYFSWNYFTGDSSDDLANSETVIDGDLDTSIDAETDSLAYASEDVFGDNDQDLSTEANSDSAKQSKSTNNNSNTSSNKGSGEFVKISSRTGNAHIVVASFIDGDLAEDYAKELSLKGYSSSVIAPFGKTLYYRVTAGTYESVSKAVNEIANFQSELTPDAWVINY